MVVTNEKSDEGVARDGPEVLTQSEKVSAFVVNFRARVECCVSDGGAGHNGFQPWVDYPIEGSCVDYGSQCTDTVLCRVIHMAAPWWQELMSYGVRRNVQKLGPV